MFLDLSQKEKMIYAAFWKTEVCKKKKKDKQE